MAGVARLETPSIQASLSLRRGQKLVLRLFCHPQRSMEGELGSKWPSTACQDPRPTKQPSCSIRINKRPRSSPRACVREHVPTRTHLWAMPAEDPVCLTVRAERRHQRKE
ncbi:hypothetical protein NDU88_008832 [Pleurodeles waltl]|uniref:Uncharacterized protein n=1 Tax=Pleurodeles waltl TaxID=8319 RepID=A0AAV7N647_PLEWA|nr:hypothetical protein NDU88_008832 [Pleurodeles waltl]